MTRSWEDVWADRTLDVSRESLLGRLMAADGLDTAFGSSPEDTWLEFVRRTARTLGVTPGSSVFEIGCGAGAYLYDFAQAGCKVAGLDRSPSLVTFAQEAMPEACISRAEAAAFDAEREYDYVLSCGVFMYFPTLDYAREVIRRAVRGARVGVAILDIPDKAVEDLALEARRAAVGPTYDELYKGLEHLYYPREWVAAELRSAGAGEVRLEDQHIAGYDNSAYRFNAYAWMPDALLA
jgi:SAM-dependent methyltransferase